MTKIKRLGILSFGKILGFIFTFFGFVLGLTVTLLSVLGMTLGGPETLQMMSSYGFAAVIILPIFYGLIGFVGGIVFAALFNLATGWLGGLEIDLT